MSTIQSINMLSKTVCQNQKCSVLASISNIRYSNTYLPTSVPKKIFKNQIKEYCSDILKQTKCEHCSYQKCTKYVNVYDTYLQ